MGGEGGGVRVQTPERREIAQKVLYEKDAHGSAESNELGLETIG